MIHAISDRVNQIPPSGIRAFFDLVLESTDIISLGVGEPDVITPWRIREEAIYRIEKGFLSYTSNKGLVDLRLAISTVLHRKLGLDYSSDEVLITNGVSEAVDLVCRACLNPGDDVIIPEPTYVCYKPLVELSGGVVHTIDTSQSDFIPLASDIEKRITSRTKLLFLSYPNNPTGQTIPFSELEKIAQLATMHNFLVVTDEIYADLSFTEHRSIAMVPQVKERLIYLNGFSKGYSMTGWRIGYVAAPECMIDAMNKIHQYSALCAPTVSQFAALEACQYGYDDVVKMRDSYQQRARYFTTFMNDIGLHTLMPMGGLYCFTSIQSTGLTSMAFAERLLKDQRIAVVPGHVFGVGGDGYIRSCIATDFEQLKRASAGIKTLIESLCNG